LAILELGRPAEAMASFLELRARADQRDAHDSVNAYAYSQLIHGYHALGERQQAADCRERLLPFEGQVQCFVIDRALGVAAVCRGSTQVALRHLEQAVALAERADLRPELTPAHLQLGVLRRHLGRESGAVESITRGQRLASELGMDHLARSVLERGLPTTSASPSLLRPSMTLDFFEGTERFFRSGWEQNLVQHWIPSLDGVLAKLEAGAWLQTWAAATGHRRSSRHRPSRDRALLASTIMLG
jgi:tetratricopeptide (TPR) repeat protein